MKQEDRQCLNSRNMYLEFTTANSSVVYKVKEAI